jgi:hypothetical protein
VHHGKTTAAEHAMPDYGICNKFIVFCLLHLPCNFFAIVTNLCIFMHLVESAYLCLFNHTHSTHTQPQQRMMQCYTINPAFTVFITGVATILFALWMVSNSLLKSVNSSLILSQVETY